MHIPKFIRQSWALVSFVGTVSWLFSIFGGVVIAALVTPTANVEGFYRAALFVGLLGAGTCALLIATRIGIALLPSRLLRAPAPPPPKATSEQLKELAESAARATLDSRERERDAILRTLGGRLSIAPKGLYLDRSHFANDAQYEISLKEERDRVKTWTDDIAKFLRDKVGQDVSEIYKSDVGLPERYAGTPYPRTPQELELFVARRILRIQEISSALRERWGK